MQRKSNVDRLQPICVDMTVDNPEQQRRLAGSRKAGCRPDRAGGSDHRSAQESAESRRPCSRSGRGRRSSVTAEYRRSFWSCEAKRNDCWRCARAGQPGSWKTPRFILIAGTLLGLLITGTAGWTVLRDSRRRAVAEAGVAGKRTQIPALIDGVKDYAILMLGPLGEIRSWNPGAERMSGCTFEEVAGQNFSRFFPAEDVERGKPAGNTADRCGKGRV